MMIRHFFVTISYLREGNLTKTNVEWTTDKKINFDTLVDFKDDFAQRHNLSQAARDSIIIDSIYEMEAGE